MNPLRVAHLYPDHMNLYGDRGNIVCLESRCRWRDIPVTVTNVDLDDELRPDAFDIAFVGGGPDREQERIARDLTGPKAGAVRQAVEDGVVFLAVCGGYQLMGHYYRPAEGDDLQGLGIFDLHTEHPGHEARRCIGNLVAKWGDDTLVGFENHGGRTYLGPGCEPMARVVAGFGNNGEDGTEGAAYKNAFGTYLHGSFLPKNPQFADHLIARALARRGDEAPLPPLDDSLEDRAHAAAVELAVKRR